jgi:ribosome-associated toxin RatA of RatAB toxin-antitoxin module
MHRTVDAPRAVVWDVITDQELYGDVAPNLSSVTVVGGAGEGMVRRCVDTGGNEWTESCTHWEEDRSFAVSVHVENSVFHRRFFTRMDGEWQLSEHDGGVRMTITFDFEPR